MEMFADETIYRWCPASALAVSSLSERETDFESSSFVEWFSKASAYWWQRQTIIFSSVMPLVTPWCHCEDVSFFRLKAPVHRATVVVQKVFSVREDQFF